MDPKQNNPSSTYQHENVLYSIKRVDLLFTGNINIFMWYYLLILHNVGMNFAMDM